MPTSFCLFLKSAYVFKVSYKRSYRSCESESAFDIRILKMATKDPGTCINADEKEEQDDATSCCICTDVYTDPKLLPCTHTFCMKCLRETGLKSKKGPGDEMPCPICRRLFKIPAEGFHGLHTNFFIEKLIKVENLLNQSVLTKDVCDACQEENEEQKSELHVPAADAYCVECKQKLCEECCKHHKKVKLTKNHKLVPIKDLHTISEDILSDLVPHFCKIHEEKVLDVYCVKCNAVVCAICFIDDHKNHEGSHVAKFVTGFRQQIELHGNLIIECSSQAQRKQSELMKAKEDMQQKVEMLQADVVKRTNEIKQLADTHAYSILQSIGLLQRSKLKEFEVAAGEVDTYMLVLDSFKTRCQRVMAQGSPGHICSSAVNLSARATELEHQCQSLVEQEIQPCKVRFKASDLEEFLQSEGGNLIGEIEAELRCKLHDAHPVLDQRIRTRDAEEEEILDGGLHLAKKKQAVPKYSYHFSRESYVIIDQKTGIVAYDPPTGYDDPVSTVLAKLPFSVDCPFFEIEIVNRGEIGAITVGAAPKRFPIGRQPGWEPQSYGYHADDGCLFVDGNALRDRRPKVCVIGDKMGCGVEFDGGKIKNIYFTKNGKRVHEYSSNVANPSGGLFPTVGMHSSGEKARLLSKKSWRFSDQPTEKAKKKQAVPKYSYHFSRESYVMIDRKTGIVAYDPPAGYDDPVSTVLAKLPFSVDCSFFEIEIVNRGEIGAITVGAAPKHFPIGRQPGWNPESYGYHADDGCLFVDGNALRDRKPMVCATGDRMGCGVEFDGGKIKNIYFTKNGKRVHEYSSNVANPSGGLFPTVGMHSPGEKARLLSKESWRFSD